MMHEPLNPPTEAVFEENGAWWTYRDGIKCTVTKPTDPAYQLMLDPTIQSYPTIYRDYCYICVDPEFAMMGLPLCYECSKCKGHVAADDTRCDDCGHDQYEDYNADA